MMDMVKELQEAAAGLAKALPPMAADEPEANKFEHMAMAFQNRIRVVLGRNAVVSGYRLGKNGKMEFSVAVTQVFKVTEDGAAEEVVNV